MSEEHNYYRHYFRGKKMMIEFYIISQKIEFTLPKLTSVSQNIPQKAKLATSLLLEKIRTGSVSSSCQAALDVEIVDRQSVISLY